MAYSVKEIFYTLQGEGRNAGRAAVFCRFTGCNLWSGREADRETAACTFCDTDFVGTNGGGGGRFADAATLATAIGAAWEPALGMGPRLAVMTGGEPLLQVDDALLGALHDLGFEIAVETNGTIAPPAGIDWLCVSPKGRNRLAVTSGDELKLVFPQRDARPADFDDLDFKHRLLQPMDGPDVRESTAASVAFCMANPSWRLSLQTHKHLGIR